MKKIIVMFVLNIQQFLMTLIIFIYIIFLHGIAVLFFGFTSRAVHRNMNLTKQASINDCDPFEKDRVYLYSKYKNHLDEDIYINDEVKKLYKINNYWLGFTEDKDIKRSGYFIISDDVTFYPLTEDDFYEKLNTLNISDKIEDQIINKKIKFKKPYYYLIRYGKENEQCFSSRLYHRHRIKIIY